MLAHGEGLFRNPRSKHARRGSHPSFFSPSHLRHKNMWGVWSCIFVARDWIPRAYYITLYISLGCVFWLSNCVFFSLSKRTILVEVHPTHLEETPENPWTSVLFTDWDPMGWKSPWNAPPLREDIFGTNFPSAPNGRNEKSIEFTTGITWENSPNLHHLWGVSHTNSVNSDRFIFVTDACNSLLGLKGSLVTRSITSE